MYLQIRAEDPRIVSRRERCAPRLPAKTCTIHRALVDGHAPDVLELRRHLRSRSCRATQSCAPFKGRCWLQAFAPRGRLPPPRSSR